MRAVRASYPLVATRRARRTLRWRRTASGAFCRFENVFFAHKILVRGRSAWVGRVLIYFRSEVFAEPFEGVAENGAITFQLQTTPLCRAVSELYSLGHKRPISYEDGVAYSFQRRRHLIGLSFCVSDFCDITKPPVMASYCVFS